MAAHIVAPRPNITADIDVPQGGAEGMILTSGGRFAGYGFYLLKGKPVFLWNLVDLKRIKWEGTEALAPGKHTLEFDFKYEGLGLGTLAFNNMSGLGKPGTGTLKVDGKAVQTIRMERTLPMILQWDESFDIGSDTLTGVNDADYQPPFPLTATLNKLTIKIDRPQLSPEDIKKLEGAQSEAMDGKPLTCVDNLRGVRYCELRFIGGDPITKNLYGDVFNTSPLNDKANRLDTCPDPVWDKRCQGARDAVRRPWRVQERPARLDHGLDSTAHFSGRPHLRGPGGQLVHDGRISQGCRPEQGGQQRLQADQRQSEFDYDLREGQAGLHPGKPRRHALGHASLVEHRRSESELRRPAEPGRQAQARVELEVPRRGA